jgi:hypothetical protein
VHVSNLKNKLLLSRIDSSVLHEGRINNCRLYVFEAALLGDTRSTPAVIKGELQWVEQFIPIVDFEVLFGGYIAWHPTEEIGPTIGVWGKRNISRFRRILKERGASFEVIKGEGPSQMPSVVTTFGLTKKGRKIAARRKNTTT